MDTLPSAAFRKSFARLTEPVTVTANGHSIGMWLPQGSTLPVNVIPKVTITASPTYEALARAPQVDGEGRWRDPVRDANREFHPVPKVKPKR